MLTINTSHSNCSVDQWLVEHFESSDIRQVATAVIEALGNYVPGYGLYFTPGRVLVVDGAGDELVIIAQVAEKIIQSITCSAEERVVIYQKMTELFLSRGGIFPEPIVTVEWDHEGKILQIPFSLSKQAEILGISCRIVEEIDSASVISLPRGIVLGDLEQFVKMVQNPRPMVDFHEWMKMLSICEFLGCSGQIRDALCQAVPSIPLLAAHCGKRLEPAKYMLASIHDRVSRKCVMDASINAYIRFALDEEYSITEMSDKLGYFRDVPHLLLDFHDSFIKDSELEELATLLPHVSSLNVAHTSIALIPAAWGESLHELDVSYTRVRDLPSGLGQLRVCKATGAEMLHNIAALSVSGETLQELDIACTKVTTIPQGLVQLRKCDAIGCAQLVDITHLSDAGMTLEELNISMSKVTVVPHGLMRLRIFSAFAAKELSDIRHLSDAGMTLEKLTIKKTRVETIPEGLQRLKECDASLAKKLQNIENLVAARDTLEVFYAERTLVQGLPEGLNHLRQIAPGRWKK